MGDRALADLRVIRGGHEAELIEAVTDAQVVRSMDGAVELTLGFHDSGWDLLDTPIFRPGALVEFGSDRPGDARIPFELVSLSMDGRSISTTWQDLASKTLQDSDVPEIASENVTTVERVLHYLIDEYPMANGDPIALHWQVGIELAEDQELDPEQFGRGPGDEDDEDED